MGRRIGGCCLFVFVVTQTGCAALHVSPEQDQAWRLAASEACLQRRGDQALVPERAFRTDGCTAWPDGAWQDCCVEHDIVYWCGGRREERRQADRDLRQCVADKGYPVIGTLMKGGVRVMGPPFFPFPWRWGYGWPWLAAKQRSTDPEVSNND